MTLRRKMALQILAMIVGLLLVSGAALWGLNGLHQEYGSALSGYQELRHVYTIGSHLATANTLLTLPDQSEAAQRQVTREVRAARQELQSFAPPAPGPDEYAPLRAALAGAGDDVSADARQDAVNRALKAVADVAADIRTRTESRLSAAVAKRRQTIFAVALLAGAVVAAGIGLGVMQYRSVIRPLRRLSQGVRSLAAGQFGGRLGSAGGRHDELASLARDFNHMAAELDGLYHELEQKVQTKSRELVRSERLAGVGYLAAGVAHEINNPLGVIAGFAEYSLSLLAGSRAGVGGAELEKNLRVICDEAFRCKEITARLLSLARPPDGGNRVVRRLSLGSVAGEVASILDALRPRRDRRLRVRAEEGDCLDVLADEGEMKQVLLNLTLNGLEAIAPDGEVRLDVRRRAGWVELSVTDNGRGMSRQTLDRVFEPFFTHRPDNSDEAVAPDEPSQRRGTGLGLSITHAIVQGHGGRIEAFSEGLGAGSRFVVSLPAAPEPTESSASANDVPIEPAKPPGAIV